MRTCWRLAVMAAVGIALGRPVWAVHLEKIDEHIDKEQGPGAEQLDGAPVCTSFGEGSGSASSTGVAASIKLFTRETLVSESIECATSSSSTILATAGFSVAPDPGDRVGAPVTLCLQENHDLAASTTGEAQAASTEGGVPLSDPATIVRNPGAVTIFSTGPNIANLNGRLVDGTVRPFSASIGDHLTLRLGLQSATSILDAVGTGETSGVANMGINIGPCPREPAPVASGLGLVALALGLGALGSLALRRRMARQPA